MSAEGAPPDEPAPNRTSGLDDGASGRASAPYAPNPQAGRWGWLDRAKAARLVAFAGVLAVVLAARSLVIPLVPVDHDVEMRLESPQDVVGLDIRWSAPGSGEDLTTTSLRFPPQQAPSSVQASVHLPEGAYDVTITVERVSRVDSTRRHVTLGDASRVTIPLR
jgi:hypothetical protein